MVDSCLAGFLIIWIRLLQRVMGRTSSVGGIQLKLEQRVAVLSNGLVRGQCPCNPGREHGVAEQEGDIRIQGRSTGLLSHVAQQEGGQFGSLDSLFPSG